MLLRTLLAVFVALTVTFVAVLPAAPAHADSAIAVLIPRDRALRQGLEWAWVGQLAMSPTADRVNSVQIDGNDLFVTTRSGLLLAVEAETGRKIWSARLKSPLAPTSPVGLGPKHVAVVNDSRVYVFERDTGTSVMEKDLDRAQSGPPSLGADRVWVPSFDGMVTSWLIEDPKKQAFVYNSGSDVAQPVVVSPDGASWINVHGQLASVRLDKLIGRYRFDAGADVRAPLTFFAPNLFVVTTDGFAYAVDEKTGKMKWRFATGEVISQPLIGMRDVVLIITESGDVHVVDVATGLERNLVSNVKQFVAASPERWYLLGFDNRLHVVDPATGRTLRAINTERFDWLAMNTYNDRIYLGTDGGMTQCLHEIGRKEPVLLEPPVREAAEDGEPAKGKKPADDGKSKSEPESDTNLFGDEGSAAESQ